MYIRCARYCPASRFIVKATTAVRSAVCAESVRMCRCWNLPCCFRSGGAYSAAAVCKQRDLCLSSQGGRRVVFRRGGRQRLSGRGGRQHAVAGAGGACCTIRALAGYGYRFFRHSRRQLPAVARRGRHLHGFVTFVRSFPVFPMGGENIRKSSVERYNTKM